MLEVPAAGYDALAGLSVITQAATIRSDFFRELEAARPELVEYLEVDADGQITTEPSEDTLQVLEVEDFASSEWSTLVGGHVETPSSARCSNPSPSVSRMDWP